MWLLRSWAHKAHFSAKYSYELGKFVDPVFSKKRSDSRNSAVGRSRPRRSAGFRILTHRPELQDFEFLAIQAHAFLPEKQRPSGFEPDGDCCGRHQRPGE